MILFVLLAAILVGLVVFTVITVGAVGSMGVIIFSDVIVCIAIIVFIMKGIFSKRRR